jgi:hypothetical protein
MVDNETSPNEGATALPQARIIKTSGLLAEYTTGKTVAGEWFALGSVRTDGPHVDRQPAWLIVGTGKSADDAVSRLLTELEHEAQRYFR